MSIATKLTLTIRPGFIGGVNSLGYIGCSETWMSVEGYHSLSTKNLFWPPISKYSGGAIDACCWLTETSQYWAAYDAAVVQYGQPNTIWHELCGVTGTYPDQTWANMQAFWEILSRHSPGVPVYFSLINAFNPPTLCGKLPPDVMVQQQDMVNRSIAASRTSAVSYVTILPGPVMGPLDITTMIAPGNCHPNAAGELLLGAQLVDFFDG